MNVEKQLIKIGSTLKRERLKTGLSPRKVAYNIGTNHTNIRNAEAGKNITFCTLVKLCNYYGIKIEIKS